MDLFTLILLAIGLSMDAFAVSICKGLAIKKITFRHMLIVGAWFGCFQAIMPMIGYFLGIQFAKFVNAFAPWIAFILLLLIGINMIRESFSKEEKEGGESDAIGFKTMLLMAIATSIDALAVGITFACIPVNIIQATALLNTVLAVIIIGVATFIISIAGVKIGNIFGNIYKNKSEFIGGVILILLLVVGFVLLMKGADVFVDGSSSLAGKLGIPQIVIGLTIVAFGTSAPEAAISITAGIKGSAELAVSNVVGSNILNVLLILGIASVITPLAVKKNTLFIEIPFVAVITIVLLVLGMNGYSLSRFDGVILTILFLIFMGYLVYISLKKKDEEEEEVKKLPTWLMILYIIFGGAAIVGGSQLTVNSATAIAKYFGMSDRLIGLTIVALGTSLPELITSVTAACKHNADIAIGNIVGSNIFNILFVLGITALLTPVQYSKDFIVDNIMAVICMVMLFLCVILTKDKKLNRAGGILMLLSYAAYFVCFIVLQIKLV